MATASRRSLADIDAEILDITGRIRVAQAQIEKLDEAINRSSKEIDAFIKLKPVAVVRPPAPLVAQKATTAADIKLKAADSYKAINTWVQEKIVELNLQAEKGTEANTAVRDVLTPADQLLDEIHFPGEITKYQRMVSSGNDNDCLIHSFLNALSPEYRTLRRAGKDPIASYFRRNILADLYSDLITKGDEIGELNRILRQINGQPPLDTHVAGQFGIRYKISILIRDRERPETKWNLEGDTNPGIPFIMIYNPGSGHYEAIRYEDNNRYIFDRNIIGTWEAIKEAQGLYGNEQVCKIEGLPVNLGDVIKYGNNRYSVIDMQNSDDGTTCKYIHVVEYNKTQTKAQLDKIDSEMKRRIREGRSFTDLKIFNIANRANECSLLGHVDDHQAGVNYSTGGRRLSRKRSRL